MRFCTLLRDRRSFLISFFLIRSFLRPSRVAGGLALTVLGVLPVAAAETPPSAFELLESLRQTYAKVESYQDLGEIERTEGEGEAASSTVLFFETSFEASQNYLWRMHGETENGFEEKAIWRNQEEAFVFSSVYQQYKPVASLTAELANALDDGSYDALVVPLALAGDTSALSDPEGAVVEGPEVCGETSCWVLITSRMGGSIESELRIDRDTGLIRDVRVRIENRASMFTQTLKGNSSNPDRPMASESVMTIHVTHHPISDSASEFQVPADARQVTEWEPKETPEDEPWLDLGLTEEITVSLFSVIARIVDSRGEPLSDLSPSDLVVRVGSQEIPVLSLDWFSSGSESAQVPVAELAEARGLARSGELAMAETRDLVDGKLLVLFLQVDFEPSRLAGHLKLLPDIEKLLQSLAPNDRVAILSFDSHLKLWQDFSRNRETTFETLKQAVSTGTPVARRGQAPSLYEHFDQRTAKDVTNPERALEVIADSLALIPGQKDILYLGWGLGQYVGGVVQMTPDYAPAVRALDAADATVFVLDVSQSDSHSLELGLQQVAAHTGGTYSKTFHFASQAVKRLARSLSGHYVINLDRSALPGAKGRLTISLRARTGSVLFKPLDLG